MDTCVYRPTPLICLKDAPASDADIDAATDESLANGPGRRILVCRDCGQMITWPEAMMRVDGQLDHVKFNPHGVVHRFTTFSQAPGCSCYGSPSLMFTWFGGYAWQICGCQGCGEHLGWRFTSSGSGFFGLITDKLMEQENADGD